MRGTKQASLISRTGGTDVIREGVGFHLVAPRRNRVLKELGVVPESPMSGKTTKA